MSRKGVTPVIATTLLILIAVSAVSTAAVFLRDTTGDVRSGVEDRLSEQERIEGTSIGIERGFNDSGDILLTVRNTGSYVVVVEESDSGTDDNKKWDLYVDGKPKEFDYLTGSNPDRVVIDPGETKTIDTNSDFPSSGNYKRLEIHGKYETESGIICSNSGNEQSC